jgi:hypothetical protein
MLLIWRWRKRRRSVPGIGHALLYQRCDDRISGVQSDRVLHLLFPRFGVAASAPTASAIYEGVAPDRAHGCHPIGDLGC